MAEAALRGLGSRQRSRRLFAAGMILVGGLGLVAAAAPWLTSYDPDAIVVPHYAGPLPPGGAHPLGTDTLGRDVWARLAYGARTSLFVGGLAMTLSLGIGVTVGLVGGYFGGAVDTALMWLVDLVLTMPTLLLLIVLPGVVVLAALGMSGAIGIDAGLSYLGLGVPLPTPSWGRMVSEVQTYFAVAPWLVVLPGVAVSLAVIGLNLVGYGLIDLLGERRG